MANPPRFSKVGSAGGKGRISSESLPINVGDWSTQTIAFKPALVASTSQQSTGLGAPPGAAYAVLVDVITPASGTTPTLNCGPSSNPTGFCNGIDISTAGVKLGGSADPSSLGEEIEYSFGSADLTGLDCEIVIVMLGKEV